MFPVGDIASYDITGKGFDKKIEQKVRVCHMNYLVHIDRLMFKKHGIHVYVSLKSSWRPKWWELIKKRSGLSQHVYSYLGATDITCDDFAENWEILLEYLINHTSYTRLAVYHTIDPKTGKKSGFIHGDYKNECNDAYVYKIVGGAWKRDYPIERNN
ncbi:hypothetical protein [Flagellimonas nanhaiensis]|uniref:Uncharacterized protein n=1 Tax=Flagellimonas nanhaiensis TaxID=2292706 RepID=A0A371JLA3_9FLAO|nr:hypothetical protein [Allomuricauda nanhaiensis]RDY57730.1 hypothetical protein DX873_17685 [Allomuricauda nanhaiensis]